MNNKKLATTILLACSHNFSDNLNTIFAINEINGIKLTIRPHYSTNQNELKKILKEKKIQCKIDNKTSLYKQFKENSLIVSVATSGISTIVLEAILAKKLFLAYSPSPLAQKNWRTFSNSIKTKDNKNPLPYKWLYDNKKDFQEMLARIAFDFLEEQK
jgi:hypothetical protein